MALVVPVLQFRPNCIIEYNSYAYNDNFVRFRQDEFTANLLKQTEEKTTYSGRLCDGAKKRLRKALDNLIDSTDEKIIFNTFTGQYQPFRLSFITLTMAQHSPIEAKDAYKNCLTHFLQWMRRQHKCYCYVWKAELQQRGQIHYHITCDTFINAKHIQDKWNYLMRKAGYLDDFYKQKRHYNAPSTDVASVRSIDKMGNYMVKMVDKDINLMSEMMKDFQNESSVRGKVWDCSLNLKKHDRFDTIADYQYVHDLEQLAKSGEVQCIKTESCIIYQFKNKRPRVILSPADLFRFNSLMHTIRTKEIEETKRERKPPDKNTPSKFKLINLNAQLNIFSRS